MKRRFLWLGFAAITLGLVVLVYHGPGRAVVRMKADSLVKSMEMARSEGAQTATVSGFQSSAAGLRAALEVDGAERVLDALGVVAASRSDPRRRQAVSR